MKSDHVISVRPLQHAGYGIALLAMLNCPQAGAADWLDIPLPSDVTAIVVADHLDINRLPVRIWQFRSRLRPDQLLEFYRNRWAAPIKNTMPAYLENTLGAWRVISRVEGGFLITVQVDDSDRAHSSGLLSIAQLHGKLQWQAKNVRYPDYPKMTGSTVLEELNNRDHGKSALTVVSKNWHSVASNRIYYRQFFQRRGWSEIGSGRSGSVRNILIMQKGPLETTFSFAADGVATRVVGVIQYPEERR